MVHGISFSFLLRRDPGKILFDVRPEMSSVMESLLSVEQIMETTGKKSFNFWFPTLMRANLSLSSMLLTNCNGRLKD